MLTPPAVAYAFLLGLASGTAGLALSAYRRVTPRWLKWMLIATALWIISQYVAMAILIYSDAPLRAWGWRLCWQATLIGLSLPAAFAVDRLLRHPAMTPSKLLRWLAPWLLPAGCTVLFGQLSQTMDPVAGSRFVLSGGWWFLGTALQLVFLIGLVGMGAWVIRKVPDASIRSRIMALTAAYVAWTICTLADGLGAGDVRLLLLSEILVLGTLWYAYDPAPSAS